MQHHKVKGKDWNNRSYSLTVFSDVPLAARREQADSSFMLFSSGAHLAFHNSLKSMNWLSSHQLELGYILTALVSLQLIRHLLSQEYSRVAINCSSTSAATSLRTMQWSLPSIIVTNFQNESSILAEYSSFQSYSFLSQEIAACFWHLVLMCFWEVWIISDYQ